MSPNSRPQNSMIRLGLFASVCAILPATATAGDSELGSVPADAFTVAVIPDTQRYQASHSGDFADHGKVRNDVFAAITQWIVDHRQDQNIRFVSHVGDIVDENIPEQWEAARQCMDRLHGVIPYGLTVGNHDMVRTGDSSLFQQYFPEARFKGFTWYAGSFHPDRQVSDVSGNNANSAQLFSTEEFDCLVLHLECNAPDDVLTWADRMINKYSDRRVMITTHMDLGPLERPKSNEGFIHDPKGRMTWKKCHSDRGNTPEQMWEKCFQHHKNLFLICSGDQSRTQTMHLTARGINGNLVHSCLSDYGSDGSVRLYRFVPSEDRIDVITYNVIRGELTTKTRLVQRASEHQFSFDYPMSQKGPSPQ